MVNVVGPDRNGLRAIALCALALCVLGFLLGCSASQVDTLAVSPTTQSLAVGQTAQFSATGTIGHGQHPSSNQNVTSAVSWTSSAPAVATISASGMATAVSPGTTTITASMAGFGGTISTTATVTVTGTTGSAGGNIVSVAVIPGSQSVAAPNQTTQFIAVGTNSAGGTVNVTNQVAWTSSSTQIATIGASTGLATSVSKGSTTISAIFVNSDKTVATGTATFTVSGGAAEQITALTVNPNAETLSASQQGQLIAIGTAGSTGLQEDVTSSPQTTWSSSIPSVASVSSSGQVTGVSPGSSLITAEWKNTDGSVVSATATVTVSATTAPEPLLSLTIIPSTITVGNLQGTGNFMAIGTFSTAPTVRDLTNSVKWISSAPNVFPVNTNGSGTNQGAPGGIVTAYGNGGAVIIAEATDPTTGSIQTATATFNCPLVLPNPPTTAGSCFPGSQASALLSTVTVYNEGLNTTNWLVTAPSATGTQDVLHCGPGWTGAGGSVCVATYPIGTTLTLTAPAQSGVSFGGWSDNCTPSPNPASQAGPNQCTMILTDTNVTVGAIFN
ncbi:hypothetical protein DYQ86_06165 [Acidobacteria bacterium AB60]|nr:hypothetical protein DYQ86_06165 [Acidobacteria bacterium AB60]